MDHRMQHMPSTGQHRGDHRGGVVCHRNCEAVAVNALLKVLTGFARGALWALGGALFLLGLYALVELWLIPAVWALLSWAARLGDMAVVMIVTLLVGSVLWGVDALDRWWRGER